MPLTAFLNTLKESPETIQFADTTAVIEALYQATPCAFQNGDLYNSAEQNQGSCKLLAFAKLHNLSQEETLQCFGDFYRIDVLQNPNNDNHQNIRNFMRSGWDGISFTGTPLQAR